MSTPWSSPINGTVVHLPFKPYPVQIEMISRKIACCKNVRLICYEKKPPPSAINVCCSFQRRERIARNPHRYWQNDCMHRWSRLMDGSGTIPCDFYTTVIYCSKTHLQLRQAVDEFATTVYATKYWYWYWYCCC